MKRALNLVVLCLSMLACISGLFYIHIYLSGEIEGILFALGLSFPGLIGFYCSTKIKKTKLKWLLLGLNYLFATYSTVLIIVIYWLQVFGIEFFTS
ncbi:MULTISPECIES: hypothetical protein [Enterococcus]|uniref:hypothetical protein n=1 Tax=Enterococcus TaxID=1350 RepID=UPI0008EF1957|nr:MULTISPECIES: hypothetical protein [Enterococcus]PTO42537.1 hypothetical protein C6P50_03310 [Enterococcus mundtii]SFM15392.1 hypothetical protein SAMN04487758_11239 [Enterococcus mundtii]